MSFCLRSRTSMKRPARGQPEDRHGGKCVGAPVKLPHGHCTRNPRAGRPRTVAGRAACDRACAHKACLCGGVGPLHGLRRRTLMTSHPVPRTGLAVALVMLSACASMPRGPAVTESDFATIQPGMTRDQVV